MSIQITKQYYWKVLTSDGLLKDLNSVGDHYKATAINDKAPFASEIEAVMVAREHFDQEDWCRESLVLHCEYIFNTD